MDFKYASDKIRYDKIIASLQQNDQPVDDNFTEESLDSADDLTKVVASKRSDGEIEVTYAELWNENCLNALFQKPEYKNLVNTPLQAIQKFFKDRFTAIAAAANLKIVDYDIYPTESIGEAVLKVELVQLIDDKNINELVSEMENTANTQQPPLNPNLDTQQQLLPQGGSQVVPVRSDSKFNQVYTSRSNTQDPKVVDMLLKTVFQEKFDSKYGLSTDVGEWHPVKTLSTPEGKFMIQWDHEETNKVHIKTTFFENGTNKITVIVSNTIGKELIHTNFEVYRIPTDSFLAERFLRKVYFSIMKKFINAQVIKIEPFRRSFVFWRSHNPQFSYSFSEPRKNEIVLDLIGFIKTAQRPVLDDFFEQNNLRHKQGYLQTLLDAAEDAGIFEFKRQGNQVLITKGSNFKAFLEGRVRKY